jgi:hypothetical protein
VEQAQKSIRALMKVTTSSVHNVELKMKRKTDLRIDDITEFS